MKLMNFLSKSAYNQTLSKSFSLVKSAPKKDFDLFLLNEKIKSLLASDSSLLQNVSNYYFQRGKGLRPLLVLLVAQATNSLGSPKSEHDNGSGLTSKESTKSDLTDALIKKDDEGYYEASHDESFNINTPLATKRPIFFNHKPIPYTIYNTQRRLSEITEMIHTASLLHDDVIDNAAERRSKPSANAKYGNKLSVLAGDFLLSRACLALARLGNLQVVELLSTVISNLVQGEFMQLNTTSAPKGILYPIKYSQKTIEERTNFQEYLEKTYLKTASLIAYSLQASTILGGCNEDIQTRIYNYGKYIGIAFQIIDDCLDFGDGKDLGKPTGQDLKLGLCTAPVFYASLEHSVLEEYISRGFKQPGDVEKVWELVVNSNGIEKSKSLAEYFCELARHEVEVLPESEAKRLLVELTFTVVTRTK